MRINIDRLCELAGVPGARRTRNGVLTEGARHEGEGRDNPPADEGRGDGGGDLDESDCSEEEVDEVAHDDPMEEIIEINEADLVKELRRAKVMMRENKKREAIRRRKLQEAQLKGIIDQEVKNVLKELQLTSGWVYGKNKPKRSRHGYTHQGSYLKGIGFK